jgi:hypothetical protein
MTRAVASRNPIAARSGPRAAIETLVLSDRLLGEADGKFAGRR